MEILSFWAGILCANTGSLSPLFLVAAALFLKAPMRLVLWFLAALLWAGVHQLQVTDRGMPDDAVIPMADLIGQITSIPAEHNGKLQFEMAASQRDDLPVKATILLTCYTHCPQVAVGERWRMQVKLKRVLSPGNPGQFDYSRLLRGRHIVWTAYLLRGRAVRLQEAGGRSLLTLRERLSRTLQQAIPDGETMAIVQALTLGITHHLSHDQWDLFRRTGTTHLMVISGAHISLVAGMMFALIQALWLLSARLCLHRPAIQAGALAGMLAAFSYALLAGFSVPAQRALIAFCLLLLRYFSGQRLTAWQAWRYALLGVLVMEPHAVLLSGFYLSFLAVAILLACGPCLHGGVLKKTMLLQLACLSGLTPLCLYFFSYAAMDGLIANLLAIPLVAYVIVPLSLLSLVLSVLYPLPQALLPVHYAVKALMWYLNQVDHLSVFNLSWPLTHIWSLAGLMLSGFLLVFFPVRGLRPLAATMLVCSLFPACPRNRPGEVQMNVLDVGQGLAIVVTTANHAMVYDTGMKFYQGGDMGQMVILPYLNERGIHSLDKVVISHPDLDHRGGLNSLAARYPSAELLVDNVAFYHRGHNCHDYPPWTWDGVRFRFLPIKAAFRDKNNSSCVLQISNKAGRLLLTGDVEARAERYLVDTYAQSLASDLLVLPHHGSKTSSTPGFIQMVSPRYAVLSAGLDNRYHFPHQQTMDTLKRQNIPVWSTAHCGMLTVNLTPGVALQEPHCYRQSN